MPHLQAAAEPATQPRLRCRHILTSGHRCQSPCLRGEEFCYFHHTTRRPIQNPRQRRARQAAFELPHPEDRTAIQTAIGHVLQRIAANDLDPRRAGLLLYGLQIASSNLPKPTRSTSEQDDDAQDTIQDTVQDIILHPTLGPLAPVAECKPTRHDSLIRIFLDRMNQDPELQKRNQENQAKQNQRNPQNQQTTHPPATHPNLNLNHNHNDLNLDLDNHDLDDGLDDLDLDGQATSDLEAAAAHPQPAILPTLQATLQPSCAPCNLPRCHPDPQAKRRERIPTDSTPPMPPPAFRPQLQTPISPSTTPPCHVCTRTSPDPMPHPSLRHGVVARLSPLPRADHRRRRTDPVPRPSPPSASGAAQQSKPTGA